MRVLVALLVSALASSAARATDSLPYQNIGTYNPASYTFAASATGDVIAYFVSRGIAGYDNRLGLLVNGAQSAAGFGLDNQLSTLGQSFDLGHVNKGDALTFVMQNFTLDKRVYSDPALNVGYDALGQTAHNHVYSTCAAQIFDQAGDGAR